MNNTNKTQTDTLEAQGSRPVPDPTVLTTQQTTRIVEGLQELIETRLNAMDKGITLLQAQADRQPTTTTVSQMVEALKELTAEKFQSIAVQFRERDVRTEQMAKVSDLAVNAAFAAAKEAVGEQNKSNALSITKSENATAKQIDGILASIGTAAKTSDDKFADLKDRLTAMEARVATENRGGDTSSRTIGLVISGAVAFVVFISAIITVVAFVVTRT